MKSKSADELKKILRSFGLRPASRGCGDGHALWTNADGQTCRPVLRHHDVCWASPFALSREMEKKQICSRDQFFKELRGQSKK